jgi:hypothetical protein
MGLVRERSYKRCEKEQQHFPSTPNGYFINTIKKKKRRRWTRGGKEIS